MDLENDKKIVPSPIFGSFFKLKREDIESFIKFCQKPLKSWIGTKTVVRFITKDGKRIPNPDWRPFISTISKTETSKGRKPRKDEYILSQKSIKVMLVILGSFYTYLINENISEVNPEARNGQSPVLMSCFRWSSLERYRLL